MGNLITTTIDTYKHSVISHLKTHNGVYIVWLSHNNIAINQSMNEYNVLL